VWQSRRQIFADFSMLSLCEPKYSSVTITISSSQHVPNQEEKKETKSNHKGTNLSIRSSSIAKYYTIYEDGINKRECD